MKEGTYEKVQEARIKIEEIRGILTEYYSFENIPLSDQIKYLNVRALESFEGDIEIEEFYNYGTYILFVFPTPPYFGVRLILPRVSNEVLDEFCEIHDLTEPKSLSEK